MSKILVSGGLVPTTKDTLLDVRTRVATFSEIANIENPARFMVITVEDTGKKYEVRKLSSKIIGGIVVENSTIDITDPEALVDLGLAEELRSEDEKIRQSNESKRIEAENLRKSAEDSRKVNETNRVSAEGVREASERTRVSSEETRNANEQTRNSNESKRQSQESTRQSQESARQSNESTRNANESARKESESERKTEETSRRTAELSRKDAENIRVKNEQNRTTAENTRSSAEDRRVANETQRTANETARNNAELSREQAEGNRASTFETLKGQMQTTIQEGQTAVAASEKATSDAQKVVDNYDAKVAEQDGKLSELGSEVGVINRLRQKPFKQILFDDFENSKSYIDKDSGALIAISGYKSTNEIDLEQNQIVEYNLTGGLSSCLLAVYSNNGTYKPDDSIFGKTESVMLSGYFTAPYNCKVRFCSAVKDNVYISVYKDKSDVESQVRENEVGKLERYIEEADEKIKKNTSDILQLSRDRLGVSSVFDVKEFTDKGYYINVSDGINSAITGYNCSKDILIKKGQKVEFNLHSGLSAAVMAVFSLNGEYLREYSTRGQGEEIATVGEFIATFDCQVRFCGNANYEGKVSIYIDKVEIESLRRENEIRSLSEKIVLEGAEILFSETGNIGFVQWTDGTVLDSSAYSYYRFTEVRMKKNDSICYSSYAGMSSCILAVYNMDMTYNQSESIRGEGESVNTLGTFIAKEDCFVRVVGTSRKECYYQLTTSRIGRLVDWSNYTWTCVGDSLTEKNSRATKHYYDYVADKTSINIVNMGVSGTGYAKKKENNKAFFQRVSNIPKCDVVTIFGSFNDLEGGYELGNVTDTGTETICGCINTTLDNLFEMYPVIRLGIVSPTPWSYRRPTTGKDSQAELYVSALKDICEFRSIPFLDLFHKSNLRPWDNSFKEIVYSRDEGNGVHPNEIGHELISTQFTSFLLSLIQ